MKKIIYLVLVLASIFGVISCVDDYEDANPPRLKDGPFFKVSLSEDDVVGGESITFSIDVIDAPGGIDSVSISNPQQLGTYTIDNLDAMKGETTGTITGTFVTPTTFEGDLELTFEVYDAQLDDKGEDASKGATVRREIAITFPEGASQFTITLPVATVVRGNSFDFSIEVTDAPGGVDTVYATVENGEVVFDPTSYNNIVGKAGGTLAATYNSDEEFVGDVIISITVVDQLQLRPSMKSAEVEAVYQFAAPVITLDIDETEFKAFNEIGLSVAIDAPGTIDTVMILSRELVFAGIGDTVGVAEFDTDELNAAIGTTSGTVNGSFMISKKGYYEVMATVIDEQGRATSTSVEVLVRPCEIADIEGVYRSVASGNSAFDPVGPYADLVDTVEISGPAGNSFDVSDLSFGLWEVQGIDPEPGTIITCDNDIVSGSADDPYIIVTSGVIVGDGTIQIEWASPDGDTGSVLLTPIP